MMIVENDWIEYDATPVRRVAVRGGATCSTRSPASSSRAAAAGSSRWSVDPLTPGRALTPTGRPRPVLAPTGASTPALRLTARGRLVLLALPTLALLCGALVVSTGRVAQAAPVVAPVVTVTVHADDTLWSIAGRIAPARDPRDVVLEIERANGLRDAAVQPGQLLAVPASTLAR